jgi:sec-independent protein translocase protein TatA
MIHLLLSSAVQEIGGSEWIILILLALVLVFGTKRLPQLSRAMGRASGEFEKARGMIRGELGQGLPEGTLTQKIPRITGPVATEREKLEQMALTLGIEYSGKTDEELRSLISDRLSK